MTQKPLRPVDTVTLAWGQKIPDTTGEDRGTTNVDDDRDMQKDVDCSSAHEAKCEDQEYRRKDEMIVM